jgi:hypothetical protein
MVTEDDVEVQKQKEADFVERLVHEGKRRIIFYEKEYLFLHTPTLYSY